MKKDIDIKLDIGSLFKLFKKYSLTIFIIVLVGGLSTAVLLLNSAIEKTGSGADSAASSSSLTSFDQTTINRVGQLTSSDTAKNNYKPPSGRINPFAE